MAQVTRRPIRSPWSTGIPEYVWRHPANIAAYIVTRQLPTRRVTQVLRTGTESALGDTVEKVRDELLEGRFGRSLLLTAARLSTWRYADATNERLTQLGHHQRDLELRTARCGRAGRRTPDAVGQRLEVLDNCCEVKLVAHARQAPEPHALEAVMGLQMREAHLDLLAFVTRLLELRRVDKCASHITGILVDVPAQPSEPHVRCALRLEWASSTIARAGDVHDRSIAMNLAGSRQQFARRTGVDIALPIEREVVCRSGFDIDNYRVIDVDQVIEPIAELHALIGLGGP